ALDVFRSLDQALAGAVAAVAPATIHVSRGRSGGSGIAWAPDLVISSNFHTPDNTTVSIGTDERFDADVIGRDPGTDVALRRVVAELLAHGGVRRGYLGVGAYPAQLSAQLAAIAGRDHGALVGSVEDGGPAAQAGVIAGDIIVELAGEPITGPDSLRTTL